MNIWKGEARFSAGSVVYPPGGRLGPRVQGNLQLVYVWNGEVRIQINGRKVDVGAGESILLLPRRREEFRFADHTSTHHGWCEVIHPVLEPAFERQLSALERRVFSTPAPIRTLSVAALQLKEDRRWGSRTAFANLCSAILHMFAASTGIREPEGLETNPERMPASLVRAIEWIHADPAGVPEIAALADGVGVSQQHLSRLFSRHCGVTPATYLWNVRTEKAIELIKSTGLSLSEVAQQTGFKTQFHLSRRVRERTGLPPSKLPPVPDGNSV